MREQICVVGTGYVGMACCIGMSTLGWPVIGYDIATDRIDRLKRGIAPYHEAGIDDMLAEQMSAGRLTFSSSLPEASREASIIVVAVGTPARDDGSADLSHLHAAIAQLSAIPFTNRPTVVIRSTVPPGTSDELAAAAHAWGDVISAPEFLREGSAVPDFLAPDRIVIGADDESAAARYASVFESLEKPVLVTTRCNAELIKCCSNAFLALKISFANEVANICDAVGGIADDVLHGVGADRRIGGEFLKPGIGFGGPCFEKDVKSMKHVSEKLGVSNQLFSATLLVNEAQPRRVVARLAEALGSLDGTTIGIWGLAFKAGTNDTRDSIAMRIVEMLADAGATTVVYDPSVRVAPLPSRSRLVSSALDAIQDSDALLTLTAWPEFGAIDAAEVSKRVRRGIVIDGCNGLNGAAYAEAGLYYHGVGRPQHAGGPEQLSKAVV